MPGPQRLFLGVLGALVVTGIVVGLWTSGTPAHVRRLRLDERRVQGMNALARHIAAAKPKDQDLRTVYEDVLSKGNSAVDGVLTLEWYPRDPETGQPYELIPGEKDGYQLCAVFAEASDGRSVEVYMGNRAHAAGRQCFAYSRSDTTAHGSGNLVTGP